MANETRLKFAAGSYDLLPSIKILSDRDRLSEAESAWLQARGWRCTCETPGSLWLWSLDWDGKTILVSQETAASIQGRWDLDAYTDQHAEEFRA